MCVLCGSYVKKAGHKAEIVKDSLPFGPVPTPEDLVGVTKADIGAVSEKSVTVGGVKYQKSWHDDPSTDFGTKLTVTYGFSTSFMYESSSGSRAFGSLVAPGLTIKNRKVFSAAQEAEVKKILASIESFTNITFVESTNLDTTKSDAIEYANILFSAGDFVVGGFTSTTQSSTTGYARQPTTGSGSRAEPGQGFTRLQGTIVINNNELHSGPIDGYGDGLADSHTLAHEIAHALGLDHPHTDAIAPLAPVLAEEKFSMTNTIMGYRDLSSHVYVRDRSQDGTPVPFDIVSRFTSDFQHLDVLALQSIYGVNELARGNNTYNFQAELDNETASLGIQKVVTDSGGVDRFDGHNSRPNRIDLKPGAFSDLGYGYRIWLSKADGLGLPTFDKDYVSRLYKGEYNALITLDTEIENARGGSEGDSLGGNGVHNELEGLGGDDELKGYGGSDWLKGGEGLDVLEGGSGGDRLEGGGGSDVLSYKDAPGGVEVSLLRGYGKDGYDKWHDRVSGFEHVVGSKFNDRLEGDGGANVLVGGGGKDVLIGGGGDDVLSGSGEGVGGVWGYGVEDLRSLLPTGAKVSASWGGSLAYEGDVLVVGDPDGEGGFGRIDVFTRSSGGNWTWRASRKGPTSGSKFGTAVDIEGGFIGVGAPDAQIKTFSSGGSSIPLYDVFHLYKWTGSGLTNYTRGSDAVLGQGLGERVDLYSEGGEIYMAGYSSRAFGALPAQNIVSPRVKVTVDDTAETYGLEVKFSDLQGIETNSLVVLDGSSKDVIFTKGLNSTVTIGEVVFISPSVFVGLSYDAKTNTVTETVRKFGFVPARTYVSTNALSDLEVGKALAVKGDVIAGSIGIDKASLAGAGKTSSDLLTDASGIVQVWRLDKSGDYKQEALLFDKSVGADDDFGDSLALGAFGGYEYLAVGAPSATMSGIEFGIVYVYRYEGERGWLLYSRISGAEESTRGFGKTVEFLSDGDLLVTASGGKVYNYNFSSLAPRVTDSDGEGDRFFGGEGDDRIVSGEGGDFVEGGAGVDEVFYLDYSTSYTFATSGHVLEVTSGGVTDRLYNVERLKFLDKVYEVELGTAKGTTVEISELDLKLKIPVVLDDIAPSVNTTDFALVGKTANRLDVDVRPSEDGKAYVWAREAGEAAPSVIEVVMYGKELAVTSAGTNVAGVVDLHSDTLYTPYVVVEDGSGNRSGVATFETTSTGGSKLSNLTVTEEGSYRHEVKFNMSGDGFVYYAYQGGGDAPSVSEIKAGVSGAFVSGVTWVEGEGEHKIYLASLGAGSLYAMSEGEGVVKIANVSASYGEEDGDVWGVGLGFGGDIV